MFTRMSKGPYFKTNPSSLSSFNALIDPFKPVTRRALGGGFVVVAFLGRRKSKRVALGEDLIFISFGATMPFGDSLVIVVAFLGGRKSKRVALDDGLGVVSFLR